MASTKQIIGKSAGLTTALWSTDGETSTLGTVLSVRLVNTADREPLPSETGETEGFLLYDERDELELEIAMKSGATMPALGAALTVLGSAGKVLSAEKVRQYKQWTKIKVQATNFKALGAD